MGTFLELLIILPPYFMIGLMFADYIERKTGEKLPEAMKALCVMAPQIAFLSYLASCLVPSRETKEKETDDKTTP